MPELGEPHVPSSIASAAWLAAAAAAPMTPNRAAPWEVLPHGPLQRLEEDLWTVEGNLPGNSPAMRRRMTLVRLPGGDLLVHNGIALGPQAMAEIDAWGRPAVLIVPNAWHRLDAAAYKARYPQLRVICPAAARRKVQALVPVDAHLDFLVPTPQLRVEPLAGVRNGEAVLVVRSPSGRATLVFNDLIFNLSPSTGLKALALRLLGFTGGPKITPLSRFSMVRDGRATATHLRRLAEEPQLARILVSHGDPIASTPQMVLLQLAETL